MKNSVQGRGMTFGKQRGTIHPPCKVLPSFNSVIKSQNLQPDRIRRLVASQPAKVTFPWGVNKTAGKAWRAEKEGLQPASVSHSRATLMGAEIQVWSGHTAGAARMVFPHSYQLFQAFSTWRCMFVWKKKSGWILSHQWHLRGYSLNLERLPKKPPSFGDGGTQFYFEKQHIQTFFKDTKV